MRVTSKATQKNAEKYFGQLASMIKQESLQYISF